MKHDGNGGSSSSSHDNGRRWSPSLLKGVGAAGDGTTTALSAHLSNWSPDTGSAIAAATTAAAE